MHMSPEDKHARRVFMHLDANQNSIADKASMVSEAAQKFYAERYGEGTRLPEAFTDELARVRTDLMHDISHPSSDLNTLEVNKAPWPKPEDYAPVLPPVEERTDQEQQGEGGKPNEEPESSPEIFEAGEGSSDDDGVLHGEESSTAGGKENPTLPEALDESLEENPGLFGGDEGGDDLPPDEDEEVADNEFGDFDAFVSVMPPVDDIPAPLEPFAESDETAADFRLRLKSLWQRFGIDDGKHFPGGGEALTPDEKITMREIDIVLNSEEGRKAGLLQWLRAGEAQEE